MFSMFNIFGGGGGPSKDSVVYLNDIDKKIKELEEKIASITKCDNKVGDVSKVAWPATPNNVEQKIQQLYRQLI